MKKDNEATPRKIEHYSVTVNKEKTPTGIELWTWDDAANRLKKVHPND